MTMTRRRTVIDKLKAAGANGWGTKLALLLIGGGVGLVSWQTDKLREADSDRDRYQDVQIQLNRVEGLENMRRDADFREQVRERMVRLDLMTEFLYTRFGGDPRMIEDKAKQP